MSAFDDLMADVAPRFGRVEPCRQARSYLLGLLSPLADKNGWTLAEAAGDRTPDKMQRLLNAACWDADAVSDDLHDYVAAQVGDPDGVREQALTGPVADETLTRAALAYRGVS